MKRLLLTLGLVALPTIAAGQQAETVEYYQADLVGSIRIVYDVNGSVIARQDYTPFGTPVLNGTSMPKEGFGGNEKDDETQQMYFHARSLTARTGRFNAIDPLFGGVYEPQRWNRYAYALNNPVSFSDTYGMNAEADPDPFDCSLIDGAPMGDCRSNPITGTSNPASGGGGGFWSSVLGVLFGGGPQDLSGFSAFFNGGLSSGAGAASGFDGGGGMGGNGGLTGSPNPSSSPSPAPSPVPAPSPSPTSTQAPTGGPSPTGDAQINAIAVGVNRGAGPFAHPATYGAIVVGSTVGALGGLACISACPAGAVMIGNASAAAYGLGASALIALDNNAPAIIPLVQDITEINSPGPSLNAWSDMVLMTARATTKILVFTFGPRTGR